jgi:proteasome lid subunit RPN8/RPN11
MKLRLDAGHLGKMLAHCRREAPNEACGLLSGRDGRVSGVWPTRNRLASPTEYVIDPDDQFAVMRAIRAAGDQLLAIYHSHPQTQAYPSPRDVARAFYPEAAYVIVSLAPGEDVGVFSIREGQVARLALEVLAEGRNEVGGVDER